MTTDRYWHSVYLDEVFVQPLKKQADEAQAKLRAREYEWEANYGDGERMHTEKEIHKPKEKDWIDSITKAVPPTDYAKWKKIEREGHEEAPTLTINWVLLSSCLYYTLRYPLPLAILLYLA
jgi:hypothetical protein|tara:strand:+ start:352 stop:714 length:363 start_codon:yes stop_codon:yes gene_type:complete